MVITGILKIMDGRFEYSIGSGSENVLYRVETTRNSAISI